MAVTLTSSYQLICSKTTSTYSTLRLYGKLNSQNVSNNTSNISLQARLYGNGGSGSFSSGTINIVSTAGTSSSNLGNTSYSKGSETTLKTWTGNVTHDTNGSYTNKSVSSKLTSTATPSGTASGTITIATIPRASQPSANPSVVNIGSSTTIYTNRASNTFTHTLTYSFGGLTGTIASSVTDSTSWTIPSTFYNQFSSTEKQKNCTITCVTYSGGTNIGSKTLTIAITIPDSSKPTYTTPTKSETDTDVINAIGSSMSKAIINLSKPRYQMTLASQNGANLKSVQIKCGDATNTISLSGTSYSLNYTFTNAMTSNVVQIIITDTRDMSTTYTDTYTNYSIYTKPTITYQNIARSGLAGDVRIQLNGVLQATTISGGTTNNISASYRYKENASGSSWSASTTLTSSITYNGNHTEWYLDVTESGIASYDKSWIIEITLADNSTPNSPIVRTYTINRAVPTMSLGENDMEVNGNVTISNTAQIQNGLYSRATGQANTPVGNSMLVIKRVTNAEAPNNGVVLEFGNSTNWVGQLYIGDNATQGIYYNGWSNGTRGSWRRLADAPVSLYDNASGTTGNVTLSETSANFSYMEIYYKTDDEYYCQKVYSPNGKSVTLLTQTLNTSTPRIFGKTKNVTISGTSINVVNYCQYTINNNATGYLQTSSDRNTIYIMRVVGYR